MKLSILIAPLLDSGASKDTIISFIKAFEDAQEQQPDPLAKRRANDRERLKRYKARRNLSEDEWLIRSAEVYARDGRVCFYCDSAEGPFHIDHFVPVSKGGSNELENLRVACQRCNASKAGLLYDEWLAKR